MPARGGVFVIDVPMFDSTQPGNVNLARFVVFGRVVSVESEPGGLARDEKAIVDVVLNATGQAIDIERWMSAERIALFEEMRKADRLWRALERVLGNERILLLRRHDQAPGRVA